MGDEGFAADLGIAGISGATLVGQGGFGAVYRARQEALGRTVAVKILTASSLVADAARRFQRECLALGALSDHPHIVALHDSGTTASGHPYLVMDYLSGGSLAQRLTRDGPWPWEEVAEVGVKLAGALAAAHAAGVLHRDLKPENVLLSAYGEPQLVDFGVARVEGGTTTRSGVITGSLAHAAPEILSGQSATEASDVYSLASTLYALLAGHAPFARPGDETFHPLLTRILTEEPPDLRSRGVGQPLWDVLAAALAKDPKTRTASALAFAEALQGVQRSAGLEPTRLILRSVDDIPPVPVAPQESLTFVRPRGEPLPPVAPPSPPASRRPWAMAAAGVAAVLLATTAALALTGQSKRTTSREAITAPPTTTSSSTTLPPTTLPPSTTSSLLPTTAAPPPPAAVPIPAPAPRPRPAPPPTTRAPAPAPPPPTTAVAPTPTTRKLATNPTTTVSAKNVSTGFCLDSNAARAVYTNPCGGDNNYQRWTIATYDNTVELKNVSTGFCLDSNADRAVYTNPCGKGSNSYQRWSIIRHASGIMFKNYATGFCLDSNAARHVYTNPCEEDNNYQHWT